MELNMEIEKHKKTKDELESCNTNNSVNNSKSRNFTLN